MPDNNKSHEDNSTNSSGCCYYHGWVSFDIETLGLMSAPPPAPVPEITCVCMHDGVRDIALRIWGLPAAERAANIARVVDELDRAPRLIGYNAVLFDIEFMRRSWGLDDARVFRWQCKCLDPYLLLRIAAGGGGKMQRLLDLNGLGAKTGTGGDAITLARAGEWAALLDYCLMDARLAHQLVSAREWILVAPSLECALAPRDGGPPRFRVLSASSSLHVGDPPTLAAQLPAERPPTACEADADEEDE